MPSPITDAIPRYIADAIRNEVRPLPPHISRPSAPAEPMNPYLASLLGGLADTASTYHFLKKGALSEDNKLVAGLSRNPGMMAAVGAATNVAVPMLLKKLGKKHPKVAEALAANQGALQMGYGAINTQNTLTPQKGHLPGDSNTARMYRAALSEKIRKGK